MKSCPINYIKVDQNTLRILSFLVFIIGILFITYQSVTLLLLMLYDFSMRVFGYSKISFLFQISSFFAKLAGFKNNDVDGGAKLFASKVALLFVVSTMIAFFSGFTFTALVIMALLVGCAFLEAAFGYCVGCQIYMLLKRIGF